MNREKIISSVKNPKISIEIIDLCDSTNSVLKLKAKNENCPDVLISEEQTSGRGRFGKSFFSKGGKGIYISFLFKPESDEKILTLTSLSAVATALAIEEITKENIGIKWVNDIFLNRKKIGGILCEKIQNGVIIGIGINVSYEKDDFPEEIKNFAASLKTETGKEFEKEILCAKIIDNMEKMFGLFPDCRGYFEEYKKRSIVLNKNVEFVLSGKKMNGTVSKLNDDYSIDIVCSSGTVNLSSSEVTFGSEYFFGK